MHLQMMKGSFINLLALIGVLNSFMSSLSYTNHPIDLLSKSMDWFLYDGELRHERVKKSYLFLPKSKDHQKH